MPEYRFRYTLDGREVEGYASLGEPRRRLSGADWEVPVACDRFGTTAPIAGINPEHALELAKKFLDKLYEGLDPRGDDGTPFSFLP